MKKYKTKEQYEAILNFIRNGLSICKSENEEPVLVQLPSYLIDIMRKHKKKRFFKIDDIKVMPTYLKMCIMLISCKSGNTIGLPTA